MGINRRIGGTMFLKVKGVQRRAKGEFTYNLGRPKREGIKGPDGFHGYKEEPQIPKLSGAISDSGDLRVDDILNLTEGNVVVDLANGKSLIYRDVYYMGDGNITTSEGQIEFEIEAADAEEIAPA